MRGPVRPSLPGVGGRALEKAPLGGLGLGKRLHPRRADASLARESKPSVSPKTQWKRRTPLERQPRASRRSQPAGTSPSHVDSCDLHAELENFPRMPAARLPLVTPSSQPFETLPQCLPSPELAEDCCAQTPSRRPPKPSEPRRRSQARTGTPLRPERPKTAGARTRRQARCPRLAAAWVVGSSPEAAGSSPLPRLRVGSPSPSREGGD